MCADGYTSVADYQIRLVDDTGAVTTNTGEGYVQISQPNSVGFEYICMNELGYSLLSNQICSDLGFSNGHAKMEHIGSNKATLEVKYCDGSQSSIEVR